ncbi:YdaS family helix-turn-helix protein [uncultured Zhongshania sp.]|uniref:transcriptional regulator n=1 Tax=uncultured Zhongshania sp. TaxID=1642288 RepID=UPI0030D9485A|tara:strand:- start:285 stop:572 length:288 start_codon:yes stop_codon:yes gene_type:complete
MDILFLKLMTTTKICEPKISAFERAIEIVGGPKAIADALVDVRPQRVNHWKHRGVPAEYARSIELLTNGAVTAAELCAEVFDGNGESKLVRAANG